jgi:hypothetical protein
MTRGSARYGRARALDLGVEVITEYGSPDTIIVDAGHIRQVFLNVEINALHAMPNGGTLSIITQPQAAILGVGRIVNKPMGVDGAIVLRDRLTLSLSFDHRILDGGPAARFLQRVGQLVERPFALLL